MAESPWGPVLGGMRPRAARRLAGSAPVGYAQLVEGMIEQLELHDLKDPLAYLHGYYRAVSDLPITADRGALVECVGDCLGVSSIKLATGRNGLEGKRRFGQAGDGSMAASPR